MTGSRIKLAGKGAGGGDLVPRHPRSSRHPIFTRKGADLTREVPADPGEALLGAEVPVATLKGRVLLTIPAGTQNGRTFRLTGQGMPRLKGDGDRRPASQGPGRPADDLSDEARQARRPTFLDLVDQPDPRATDQPPSDPPRPTMQLDRFTQKAQEAIVAAQQLAERRSTAPSSTRSTSWPPRRAR